MGKILVPFDPVMMRWLNESSNDANYQETSPVFESGYDDPTYMTFRIEFGGWGASTIPSLDTFKLMQRVNTLSQTGITNTSLTNYRYDDYPQGLLDLNFAETSIKVYPGYSFNNQVAYNAYNYLLQRNEDTRAEYLKAFVEGLYDIQRKYPYLFQKIQGLNSLQNFKPDQGVRIRDAAIKIECIEGLQQKIATLLTLYKKAAWDQQYQRWILPENYRQFKMIIYIFERRTFHSVSDIAKAQTVDIDDGGQKKNFGQQVLGFLASASAAGGPAIAGTRAISGQGPSMGPSSINQLLPIHAYECDLCEFDITQVNDSDSYSAAWDNSEGLMTTLTIKIGNVRHYFKNGLTKQLKNTLIYDLASVLERDGNRTNDSDAGVARYISRSRIYENEQGPALRHGFGGGGNAVSIETAQQEWNTMINNWKRLFGQNINTSSTVASLSTVEALMQDGVIQYDYDTYWNYATITGSHFKRKGSFWKQLWDILRTSGSQWILDKQTSIEGSGVFNMQLFDWPIYDDLWLTYYSYGVQSMYESGPANGHSNQYHTVEQSGNMYKDQRDREDQIQERADNLRDHIGKNGWTAYEERGQWSAATNKSGIIDDSIPDEREIPDDMIPADDGRYKFESEAVDNAYKIVNDNITDRTLNQKIQEGTLEKPRTISNKANFDNMRDRTLPRFSGDTMEKPRTLSDDDIQETLEEPRSLTDGGFDILESERQLNEQQFNELEYVETEPMPIEYDMYTDREISHTITNDSQYETREIPDNIMKEQMEEPRKIVSGEFTGINKTVRNTTTTIDNNAYIERTLSNKGLFSGNDGRMIADQAMTGDEDTERNTGIIFETLEDARQLEIINISNDLLDGRELPDNVIVDRMELLDIISKATTALPTDAFYSQEKILIDNERKLLNLLQDNEIDEAKETLGRMSAVENKDLLKVLQEFSTNSEDIRAEQEARIKAMQAQLKKASEEAIRLMPQLSIVAAEKNPADLSKDFILVPNEFIERIRNNYMLYSLDDDILHKLSMNNLMAVDQILIRSLADTDAMTSVIGDTAISKATENKMEMVGLIQEKKSKTGKTLLGQK